MLAQIGNVTGKLRDVRLIALLIIVVAVALYLGPYVVDAMECVGDAEAPVKECLAEIYHNARSDTNLAAGVIALAIILAAWRPVPDETR